MTVEIFIRSTDERFIKAEYSGTFDECYRWVMNLMETARQGNAALGPYAPEGKIPVQCSATSPGFCALKDCPIHGKTAQ